MTSEQYLIVSYFTAVACGVLAAVVTVLALRKGLAEAVATVMAPLGRVLRRVLPVWLILVVLCGFLSVSYMDCDHHDYEGVVADRPHLVATTHTQASRMAAYLGVGLLAYTVVVAAAVLAAPARQA